MVGGQRDSDWRRTLAIGLVSGNLTPPGLARAAGVTLSDAVEALRDAHAEGALDEDGHVDDGIRDDLVGELPDEILAEVHAVAARRWFAEGPDHVVRAIDHARAAGELIGNEEMVAMADHGGRLSLSICDYSTACSLLELADELDTDHDESTRANRLCNLAAALEGLGRIDAARDRLLQAANLADRAGRADLLIRAAVQHAVPGDWTVGASRTAGLLRSAEAVATTSADRSRVLAARALSENRIPVSEDEQQFAWVTRAATARKFADEAMALADGNDTATRLLAHLAWRSTHRSPAFLEQRRETSLTALHLADEERNPSLQVEAAVMLCVDALESGDRALYEQALAVVRWVAHHDGNPRLVWRAKLVEAGRCYLDGDFAEGDLLASQARAIGEEVDLPGWVGADFFFVGQQAISVDDPSNMPAAQLDDDFVGLLNSIGRAGVAFMLARTGDHRRATDHAWKVLHQIDEEASMLMVTTRLAAVAAEVDDADLARTTLDLLLPWTDHIAVDSHAWCCDGPVAVWAAILLQRLGRDTEARDLLEIGRPKAHALNDVRSLRRCDRLDALLRCTAPTPSSTAAATRLTPRELDVLRLLTTGATNAQIAERLSFSVSTVRKDTIAIYRKLGVSGRAEAVSRTIVDGLVPLG